MSDFYGQDFTGSFAGMPDAGGPAPSINVDTSKLESAMDIFQNALRQVTDVLGRVVGGVQSVGHTVGAVFSGGAAKSFPYQSSGMPTETGRYVGYPTYFQSMKGALGMKGSEFMPAVDYQQMMARDFSERTTLLGGSVASVGAEMGAGYLGSKLLKPFFGKGVFASLAGGITGYMAAAYPLEYMMGKVNEGMEFDKLIGDVSSRAGINEGILGQGFDRGSRREVTKGLRGAGRDLNLGMGDFADIMMYGGEAGMFRGVTNSEQFTETIKVAAKNLKSLMMVLREPDVSEAIRDMATFQQWGVELAQQPAFARHASAVGRMLGTTAKGAMQIAAGGAQMGPQFGFSSAYGANMSLFGATVSESVLRSKAMTRAEMSIYGGPEGFGQQVAADIMQSARLPHMQMMLPAFMKGPGGDEVDEEALKEYLMSDDMDFRDVFKKSVKRMREDRGKAVTAKYQSNAFIEKMGGAEVLGMMQVKMFSETANLPEFKEATPFERAYKFVGRGERRVERAEGLLARAQAMPEWLEKRREAGNQEFVRERVDAAKGPVRRAWEFKDMLIDAPFELVVPPIVEAAVQAGSGIYEWAGRMNRKMKGVDVIEFPMKRDLPPEIEGLITTEDYRKRLELAEETAKETGRDVQGEMQLRLEKDIRGLGKKQRPVKTAMSVMRPGVGEELYEAGAARQPGDYQEAIDAIQAGEELKGNKFYDILEKGKGTYKPEELMGQEKSLDAHSAYMRESGKGLGGSSVQVRGGSVAYAPDDIYNQLQSADWMKQSGTITYGAKDPTSQQTETQNKHTAALNKHTDALNKDAAARKPQQIPAWAASWSKWWTSGGNPNLKNAQGNIMVVPTK